MKDNQNNNTEQNIQQEEEIDLVELVQKAWAKRKFILKVCGIAVIVGLIIALSIPKTFTTTVVLAPELQSGSSTKSSLSGLASMMGIDLSSAAGSEALSPVVYPQIVQSTPFLVDLFNIPVSSQDGEINTTYYNYLLDYQKSAWWGYIISAPGKALSWFIGLFKEEESDPNAKPNPFNLTKEQDEIAKEMSESINVSVDTKNGTITLSVSAQDPLISATLSEEVMQKLQNHITAYRTNKATVDLKFYEEMCKEAKDTYYKSQQEYASFIDRHQNVVYASFKTEQDRLNNEMQLNYNLYNQMSQQLQAAQIKVQENKPVYAVVQPASVPIKGKPSRAMVLIVIVFLAGCGAIGWVLTKDWFKELFSKTKDTDSENDI